MRALDLAIRPVLSTVGSYEHVDLVPVHRHPGPELVYTVKGHSETWCEGEPEPLPGHPGMLQVIPGGRAHDQRRRDLGRTIYVVLQPLPGWQIDRALLVDVGTDSLEARWMADLLQLGEPGLLNDQTAVQSQLVTTLLLRIADQVAWSERRYPDAVRKAIAHICAECSAELSVQHLAHRVGLSASRLTALFREHVGCAPLRYQRQVRMEMARKLLRDPYLHIADIARRCGYDDASYFSRVFQASQGCSPREWRQRLWREIGSAQSDNE